MSTWWDGNRKYILGNQRKVVCLILNLPITNNRHFHRLLSYFHGHMACICCRHGFLVSVFNRNAMWLKNRLRKWTEINGLKMWHKTCLTFITNLQVLVSCTCTCFLYSCMPGRPVQKCCNGPGIRESNMASKTGNG